MFSSLFNKKSESPEYAFDKPVAEPEKTTKTEEEWVWVTGYKGTDKDMKCRDYQYEMNKCFDISDDKDVEVCEHGFHMCLKLRDVYGYYNVRDNNRFFEVKALVRKKDKEEYGHHYDYKLHRGYDIDKLAAKSIIFVRELTADEILKGFGGTSDWSDEDKIRALAIGVEATRTERRVRTLVEVGYSETFARVIANSNRYDLAYAVGTLEGLSMDMRVWTIFNGR